MLLDKPLDFIRNHPRLVVAQDFEVACQRIHIERNEYFQGKAKLQESEEHWWIQLRVLHRNKPGISTATVLNEGSLHRLVDNALISAEQSHPDPWFRFPIWSQTTGSGTGEPQGPPENFMTPLFHLVESGNRPLLEKYEWWNVETQILRRSEREARRYSHLAGNQSWSLGPLHESIWERQKNPERLRAFIKITDLLNESVSISLERPKRVAFSPRAAAPILENISDFFIATRVDSQFSPLTRSQLGQICASKSVSLIDNGLEKKIFSYAPFDLEGIASQKTVLIDQGNLKGFLYDSQAGARDNCRSTGNNLRQLSDLEPRISPKRIVLSPGNCEPSEFWGENSNGLLVEGWIKMEINDCQEAVGIVFGWLVEGGKKSKPVKVDSFRISLAKFLENIVGLGSKTEAFGICESPMIFAEERK